jgi:hypothetical protein
MLVYLSIYLAFFNISSEKLKKVNVTENIIMQMPENFRLMTDDEIVDKYFTTTKPIALYTDPTVSVDLGVNISSTKWNAKDLEIMMSFQKSNIYSLYDEINIISEGVKDINGRNTGYIEFESVINSDPNSFSQKGGISKYTYIQYIIIGKTSLVFNFTSPIQMKSNWKEVAGLIMDSVEINTKK